MTLFAVNYLCRETLRDHAFREAMRNDPGAALAEYDLSEQERGALLAGDVGALYAMGANAFLLGYLVRFGLLGLTNETYRERLRAGAGME